MRHVLSLLVEPGFFASSQVGTAFTVGGIASVVSGVVGVFTVIRGQSFAGHALGDVSTTGGSGAFLIGVNPLLGFVVLGAVGAGAMELLGIRRERGRDVATGIVLGSMLGAAALFLHLGTTTGSTTGATQQILFGDLWVVDRSAVPVMALLGVLACSAVALVYRPLLLSSVNEEIASARGVAVRAVGVAYLLAMALAVALSCMTIGAILSTALLIGPAAAALRLTKSPARAMMSACLISVAAIWLSILLAWDSYFWPPAGKHWPVSFFVVTVIFGTYLLAGLPRWRATRADRRRAVRAPLSPRSPAAGGAPARDGGDGRRGAICSPD